MYLGLFRVDDNMARSCIASSVVKNGEVLKVKGLAPNTLANFSGVALDGECYEVVDNTDDANALFVVAAPGAHRYSNEQNYDFGNFDDVEIGKAFRGYILSKGQVFIFEEEVLDGGSALAVNDFLAVKPTSHKLMKSAGTEKAVVGQVIEKLTLHGKKMVKVLITR
ncbi:hypothetical protein [Terrisporobacter sp.]|uniref:hypothetical protein n=1 Tax=Terrisporobacter sp. TaxID=1965305 RepID=UPI00289C785C|nr:hypothetical protein [Terrisporobacter sp.]